MKKFELTKQKWLSEFNIKIKDVEPRVINADGNGVIKRYVLQAIINGEEFEFHASKKCFNFIISNHIPDFFPEGKYFLHVKNRRGKIDGCYYTKPEYTKIKS